MRLFINFFSHQSNTHSPEGPAVGKFVFFRLWVGWTDLAAHPSAKVCACVPAECNAKTSTAFGG